MRPGPAGRHPSCNVAAAMPLRVHTRTGAENVLVLEGWLSGPEVAEFETEVGSMPLPLRIDLAHVAGADASGIAVLQVQQARGATLANASPYIELLLRAHSQEPSRLARR